MSDLTRDLCPFRNWAELMDWFQQVNNHIAVGRYYYSVLSPCAWQELEKKRRKMLHLRTVFWLKSHHKIVRDFNTGWCAGKTNICLDKLWRKSSEFNIFCFFGFFFGGGGDRRWGESNGTVLGTQHCCVKEIFVQIQINWCPIMPLWLP